MDTIALQHIHDHIVYTFGMDLAVVCQEKKKQHKEQWKVLTEKAAA